MPALVAGIHAFAAVPRFKTWMAGTSPAMTRHSRGGFRPRDRPWVPHRSEGMERREALFLRLHAGANKPAQFAQPDCKAWARPAGRARLSTLHRGVFAGWTGYLPVDPGPRLRAKRAFCVAPSQLAPSTRPVVAVGRGSGALRVRGLRRPAPAEAPPPRSANQTPLESAPR
jgi:hypothetical protein